MHMKGSNKKRQVGKAHAHMEAARAKGAHAISWESGVRDGSGCACVDMEAWGP